MASSETPPMVLVFFLKNTNFKTFALGKPLSRKALSADRSGFMGCKVTVYGVKPSIKVRVYGER
jgi:hypothetical protein